MGKAHGLWTFLKTKTHLNSLSEFETSSIRVTSPTTSFALANMSTSDAEFAGRPLEAFSALAGFVCGPGWPVFYTQTKLEKVHAFMHLL